jgi:uncharacterized membrane protein YeaQ/YmgE (transglycosylase-associated protein family)
MKRTQSLKRAVVIGIVGAMVLGETVPSFAAPVPSSTAIVKTTAPNMLDQVRSRRGRAIGAGVALGVIGALAGAAAAQNQGYYYGPGYYGGPYGPGYYGPGYYGSGYYGDPGYYYGYRYDPGPAIALGVIGAAASAIAGAPYRTPRLRRGGCWVETDSSRGFGYWGRCR